MTLRLNPGFVPRLLLWAAWAVATTSGTAAPIRQHSENPLWFEFRGRTLALITSAEHYGAVLNPDFDFRRYLEALQRDGMNNTRVFAGSYVEPPGAFGIERNTLAPAAGRFLAPWARSPEQGYAGGGNQFDLDRFSDEYLTRLKDFLTEADRRGIIVELTLFCSTYSDRQWAIHPFNPTNHVQSLAMPDWRRLHTPDNGPAMAVQERLVRWLVRELNAHENLFYEIQNEPWADNSVMGDVIHPYLTDRRHFPNATEIPTAATVAWQSAIARIITDEEERLPNRHLIAQNIANFRLAVAPADLVPGVSLINFHYALPEAATWNIPLGRIVGCDETGFAGNSDDVYRRQAWNFVMSGGGLFNGLDYSFTVGREDGSDITNRAPGGGSPTLRRQLRVLSEFVHGFDLGLMRPDANLVAASPGVVTRTLSAPGKAYAVYVEGRAPTELQLRLPEGRWVAEWISPLDGQRLARQIVVAQGTLPTPLPSPAFDGSSALRIVPQPAERASAPRENPMRAIEDEPGLPRVLLIGDSISIGYTLEVRRRLAGIANVHRIPMNGGPTTNAVLHLDDWLGTKSWDVIHFNCGLHDLKIYETGYLVPLDTYVANLRHAVERLQKTGATLIWATTTPVPENVNGPRRLPEDVRRYNEAALTVMREAGVQINDLYAFMRPHVEALQRPRDVHFTEEGSVELGKEVARVIGDALTRREGRGSTGAARHRVSFRERPNDVAIEMDGVEVATYVFRHEVIQRPFLANLTTRTGVRVTRAFPPTNGEEATDHDTMHPGAWLAFGDLSGTDFWRNKGRVEHVRFVASPAGTSESGGFIVLNRYRVGDRTIAEETAQWRFLSLAEGWMAGVNSEFQPADGPLTFGDQEEMGFGIRVTAPLAVRNGGWMVNSDGQLEERGVWGKTADWVACGGQVGDASVALQLMTDPGNFRPSWFHARNYGLVVANPFGRKAMTGGEPSKVEVSRESPRRLGFGLYVHERIDDRGAALTRGDQTYRRTLARPDPSPR